MTHVEHLDYIVHHTEVHAVDMPATPEKKLSNRMPPGAQYWNNRTALWALAQGEDRTLQPGEPYRGSIRSPSGDPIEDLFEVSFRLRS